MVPLTSWDWTVSIKLKNKGTQRAIDRTYRIGLHRQREFLFIAACTSASRLILGFHSIECQKPISNGSSLYGIKTQKVVGCVTGM
jgi:hypothetical protein